MLALIDLVLPRAVPSLIDLNHVVHLLYSLLLDHPLALLPKAAATKSTHHFDRLLNYIQQNQPHTDPDLLDFWLAKAFATAITNDNLPVIQRIHEIHPAPLETSSLGLALEFGSLETVQWVVEHRCDRLCSAPGVENLCSSCLYEVVPSSGVLHDAERVIEWLLSREFRFANDVNTDDSIRRKLVNVMRLNNRVALWLESNGHVDAKMGEQYISEVVGSGPSSCASVVRVLLDKGFVVKQRHLIRQLLAASIKPVLEPVVEVVVSSHLCDTLRDSFVYGPVRDGGVKVLQWTTPFLDAAELLDPVYWKRIHTMSGFRHGHVDWIKWFVREHWEEGMYVFLYSDTQESETALKLFEVAHELGVPINSISAVTAATRGHLDVIKLLHARNNVSNHWPSVVVNAATYGHLHVLQWLHSMGFGEYTTKTIVQAAANGHLHVVQWLIENRLVDSIESALVEAADNGHLRVVQWLRSKYPETNTIVAMAAAAARRLDMLVWLHENSSGGCLSCVLRAVLASTEGSRVSLSWLRSRVPPGPPCQLHCLLAGNLVNSTARAIVERGDVQAIEQLSQDHFNDLKRVGFMLAELATNRGHAEMREWLYDMFGSGEREVNSLARQAAFEGNLDVLQDLHVHHPKELTRRLQTLARLAHVAGHEGILAWLEKEYRIQFD